MLESRFHLFFEGVEPSDWGTFRNEIASIIQGCMDALGFHLAASLRVEVASLVIDGNRLVTSTNGWPQLLGESSGSTVSGADLGPFIQAATAEPLVRLALADLRAAIDAPDETLFLSYRAVESVRQWFLENDAEDEGRARAKSWERMRETLSVDETTTRRLEALARGRRHGGGVPPTAPEREEAPRLARAVVAALIVHLTAVNQ